MRCRKWKLLMTAMGHSRHFTRAASTSGLVPTPDMSQHRIKGRNGPEADMLREPILVLPAIWRLAVGGEGGPSF